MSCFIIATFLSVRCQDANGKEIYLFKKKFPHIQQFTPCELRIIHSLQGLVTFVLTGLSFKRIFYSISLTHPEIFIRMYSMQYSEKPQVSENIFRMETFYKWQIFFSIFGLMKNGFETSKKCIWNIWVQGFWLDFRIQIYDSKAISSFLMLAMLNWFLRRKKGCNLDFEPLSKDLYCFYLCWLPSFLLHPYGGGKYVL